MLSTGRSSKRKGATVGDARRPMKCDEVTLTFFRISDNESMKRWSFQVKKACFRALEKLPTVLRSVHDNMTFNTIPLSSYIHTH